VNNWLLNVNFRTSAHNRGTVLKAHKGLIYTAGAEGIVKIWDETKLAGENAQEITKIEHNKTGMNAFRFLIGWQVCCWVHCDAHKTHLDTTEVTAIAVHPLASRLATGSKDFVVNLFNLPGVCLMRAVRGRTTHQHFARFFRLCRWFV
jgi:WD40 repeat protein